MTAGRLRAMVVSSGRRVRMDAGLRREQLLAAGATHIEIHGLDFSLDDVARHAEISPPLMRHYFKNREGLLVALVEQGIEAITSILTGPDGGDLRARLERYLQYIRERPWAHRLWMAASLDDDALSPLVREARRRLVGAAFGTTETLLDADERFRGTAWIAVVESAVEDWLEDGAEHTDDVLARLLDVARRLDVPPGN